MATKPDPPAQGEDKNMPRYLVQRTFPDGLGIPATPDGARICKDVEVNNNQLGVSWKHSYVSADKTVSYCIYDGPDPEAIRKVAETNSLPVDRITEVRVLDPYFYH
jgi:hypothetical protein